MFNLLEDRLINATIDGRTDTATLPEVYASLMADTVDAFPALRPHQRHAWHAFLVQLGAMALHRAGCSTPPDTAVEWYTLLRGLTSDHPNDEPWQLVVSDITKPAFMQPPASNAGKLAEFKNPVKTPDELDMLVTSKNHDLKAAVASAGTHNDWLFALISLQTTEGFSGAGNYGISRMNGGLGCRPAFTITPSVRPGIHVRRDLGALLEQRDKILDLDLMRDGGVQLLWTKTWDGTNAEALLLNDLDPFFIEICRRIRLQAHSKSSMSALRATSKAARIEAKAQKGRTGDPWTPINIKEGKSLTLAPGGFTYKHTVDYLLTPDWQPAPLFFLTTDEWHAPEDMLLVARGMVRGQGKTGGYHERIVPFKEQVIRGFVHTAARQELSRIAGERIEQAGKVQRILRHAVSVFAAGGNTKDVRDEHRSRANLWANKLNEIIDTSFFDALQTEFAEDDPGKRKRVRNMWLKNDRGDGVINQAWRILQDAEDSLPCPSVQRYRARVRADSVFQRGIHGSKGLYDQEEGDE